MDGVERSVLAYGYRPDWRTGQRLRRLQRCGQHIDLASIGKPDNRRPDVQRVAVGGRLQLFRVTDDSFGGRHGGQRRRERDDGCWLHVDGVEFGLLDVYRFGCERNRIWTGVVFVQRQPGRAGTFGSADRCGAGSYDHTGGGLRLQHFPR